ncbi:MAG: tetratricopeptide repeat protein [Deltaproteobacteria bacterium]|nr:tetratricopeptide repeat protein [Deltaproteobacteria bacterium]
MVCTRNQALVWEQQSEQDPGAALQAARLKPALDHGGPDRMLGGLYLRAPGPPVSIGDLEKAIVHYQRAVSQYPDFVENRLGLAKAYLEDEDPGPACDQLQRILICMPPANEWEEPWKQALDLMKQLCEMETLK